MDHFRSPGNQYNSAGNYYTSARDFEHLLGTSTPPTTSLPGLGEPPGTAGRAPLGFRKDVEAQRIKDSKEQRAAALFNGSLRFVSTM